MCDVAGRLEERVRAEGPIPFAVFMEEALYGEGGYYRQKKLPIGERGDFVTGSSHSRYFGAATAKLLHRLDTALDRPADYLEVGCGDGRHLGAVATALGPSERRLFGYDRVERELPPGVERTDDLGRPSINGLVFSYELFDALPVHRLVGHESGLGELQVALDADGEFCWQESELSDPALAELVSQPLEPGQVADLSPGWRPLYRRLAESLDRGLLVTIDYGFEAPRLLDPRVRRHGTLACYRHHRVHRDPFVEVGRQDITAHVDFSALIAEGEAAGLETVCWTRQAPWLVALGLLDLLAEQPVAERMRAMQLLDLDGMGEELRVLVQARGIDARDLLPEELLEL